MYGYFDGVAAPALRIQAARIEDKGVVEVIYFSEDFEWLLPWAENSGAGQTVENDGSGTAPQIYSAKNDEGQTAAERCWLTDTDWKKVAVLLSTCRNVT